MLPFLKRPLVARMVKSLGIVLLLGGCVVGMAALPVLGYTWLAFAAVAAVAAWFTLGLLCGPGANHWRRSVRWLVLAILTSWLSLIVWSVVVPGSAAPPAKSDPALVRVATWNIHCGRDDGPPWKQFDWPARKLALRIALEEARPDLLCVQEANPEQVAFLEEVLPGHDRVGIGRDGEAGGEHCAIFFDRQRFEFVEGDTFWLEAPTDQPQAGSALSVKRICTWVRLHDRVNQRVVRVYNTHLYLTEAANSAAVEVILTHVAAGDRSDAVLLTADFNAGPTAPSRRRLTEEMLRDSATRPMEPTFHLYGIGLRALDGVLVDRHWRVRQHLILRSKPGNLFPSDHFGVLTDLGPS